MLSNDIVFLASSALAFTPDLIDPSRPTGLWFCDSLEDTVVIQNDLNACFFQPDVNLENLKYCEGFLSSFPYIFVAIADQERREAVIEKIQNVFPQLYLYAPGPRAFRGCRSIEQFCNEFGLNECPKLLLDAEELPVYGVVNLADVGVMDLNAIPRTLSGFPEMDAFTGGFFDGALSLWTGERGHGKSTILGQILLEAIEQDRIVCAYSGELSKEQFKLWIMMQAAGPSHVGYYTDRVSGRAFPAISPSVEKRINEWLSRKFYLYDIGKASAHNESSILKTFRNVRRCFNASVFLVDNIMTVDFSGKKDSDFYRTQSTFVGKLVQFAKSENVHVHMVAHPRKADKGRKHLSNDDVGGSGDLTNRADNVFSLEPGTKEINGELKEVTILSCLKNRMFGGKKHVALLFDPKSRRFYRPEQKPDRKYSWDTSSQQIGFYELPADTPTPFDDKEKIS